MKEYSTSDVVPRTGEYVCISCGEITEFEEGDDFSVCGFCEEEDNAGWVLAVGEEEDSETKEGEEEIV